jgi:hypothetical protein
LDTARLFGYDEEKIKRVEEALAKYSSVDDAMEEIRKLSLDSNRSERSNNSVKKIIGEKDLETYLSTGWDMQSVLHSGRILITKNPQSFEKTLLS